MTRLRLGILISGRGSNMSAILEAAQASHYPAEPVLVLSNRPQAAGLQLAESMQVPASAIDHKPFGSDRQAFEVEIDAALRAARVEIVALAGFMRILTPWFIGRWAGRLINIHPSLLPKYPGLDTHARALAAGETQHGCSVHWVTEGVDEGDVIAQAQIPVQPSDTAESLRQRVLIEEHKLYPQALALACKAVNTS